MQLLRRLAAGLARRGPGEAAAALAVVVGAILVAISWWRSPSFWIDELFVALNVRDRGPLELLGPLDFRQAMPIGFLLSEKLATTFGGDVERALRLLPAIAAAGAILLLPQLFRRFGGGLGIAAGSWLVVSSAALYRHGIQAKPYAFDLAAAVVVPLLFSLAFERGGRLRGYAFGAAAGFAFFSFASWIVTAGTLAGLAARRDGRRFLAGDRRGRLSVVVLASAGGAALALARHQTTGETGDFLRFFWRQHLYGVGSEPVSFVSWSIAWLRHLTGGYLGAYGAAAFAVLAAGVAGWLMALRRRGASTSAPLFIFALAFTLAAAALYPVSGRLALFLLPLAATGLTGLLQPLDDWISTHRRLEFLGALLIAAAGLLRMSAVAPGAAIERPREMMKALATALEPGDTVDVRYSAVPAWAFYGSKLGLPGARIDVALGDCAREAPQAYRAELAPLCGRRRVWVVFSHSSSVYDHELAVGRLLAAMGKERTRVAAGDRARGRLDDVAVLYDFSDAAVCERELALPLLESLAPSDPRSCRQFDRVGAAGR